MKRKRVAYPLGAPSKMVCASWGISALRCHTGSKLAQIEGTVCNGCYALGGHYRYPNVLEAHEKRLADYKADVQGWIDRMVFAIAADTTKTQVFYFRWFDSGDLQSVEMLDAICKVARRTPKVKHWLPTKEHGFVKAFLAAGHKVPSNLTIRLSAYKVDQEAPALYGLPGSGVVTDASKSNCQAYKNETVNCGDCRKCWDKAETVYYPLH